MVVLDHLRHLITVGVVVVGQPLLAHREQVHQVELVVQGHQVV
jgi:hypothetical protein